MKRQRLKKNNGKKPDSTKSDGQSHDAKGRFIPGNTVSRTGGRPKGARNKLGEAFILALQEDFEKYGVKALRRVRRTKPVAYIRVIASLMPKELSLDVTSNPTKDLSDEELKARYEQLEEQFHHAILTGAVPGIDRPKARDTKTRLN